LLSNFGEGIVIENPDVKGRITLECDEMWSFVGNKKNKQWIWLSIDRKSRKIVGMQINLM
jgi:hypothetical protein